MNASVPFPSRLHWTAQQLADAVPLRLHELFVVDVAGLAAPQQAANGRAAVRRGAGYAAAATLPARFQIR